MWDRCRKWMSQRAQTWLPCLNGPGAKMSTSHFHLSHGDGNENSSENVLFCTILLQSFSQAQWDYWYTRVTAGFQPLQQIVVEVCVVVLQCRPEMICVKAFYHLTKAVCPPLSQAALKSLSLCFRIKIEEEYAKNLSKLSLSPLAAQEEGWVQ